MQLYLPLLPVIQPQERFILTVRNRAFDSCWSINICSELIKLFRAVF